jgi:equilibrative nucleoside transporter 1/2/3
MLFESPSLSFRSIRAARTRSGEVDVGDFIKKLEAQEQKIEDEPTPPELREACILVTIVGVGYLFPFSALTQPVDYWKLLFPDFNIEFPLTTIYMWTNLVMLALLVFCGGAPNFTRRIVGGFVGQLLVLIFVPTSYFLYLAEDANERLILLATAAVAIVTAFIDSSAIALIAQYPLRVQEYFQLGVGISTMIGSIYRDATKLAFPPDAIVESSLLYFYTGAATITLCIVAYYRLLGLPLSQKCLAKAREAEEKHAADVVVPTEESHLLISTTSPNEYKPEASTADLKYAVLKKIFFNEMMVCLLFMSTLALWPPLVTEIPSYNFKSLQSSGWWSLILLTVFSFADCAGRLLVRFRLRIDKDNIWIPVLARFALFPLIVCCVKGLWLRNDFISALLVGLLGLTNGYVGTLAIVLVNDCCDSVAEQAIAGTFTSFFLNSGLVLGATIGLIFDKLV